MIDTFTSTPFFGLAVSVLCWCFAGWLQRKTKLLVCNPVLVTALLVIAVLLVFDIPLENYNAGGSIIKLMLGPATAVLALNIYQQRAVLKRHFLPVVLGCFAGSLVSILFVLLLCKLFQADAMFSASMMPKSVTTAIALGISENAGGIPGLTAAAVVITGVEGAMLAPLFAKVFHITDPVAEGVAIGSCSHAIGTSKAMEIGSLQGAMSSIAICVCGILTSILVMFF
jgi:predicted murein hydrolase (TIGR00659 family)